MSAADGDSTVGVDAGDDPCAISNSEERFGLRVGSIFIILVSTRFHVSRCMEYAHRT